MIFQNLGTAEELELMFEGADFGGEFGAPASVAQVAEAVEAMDIDTGAGNNQLQGEEECQL
jgi:hypothetical protein